MNTASITQTIERLNIMKAQGITDTQKELIEQTCAQLEFYRDKVIPLSRELAGILDASIPLLEEAGKREAKAEARMFLPERTLQDRAAGANDAIKKSHTILGFNPLV